MKGTVLFAILLTGLALCAGDIDIDGYTVKQFDAAHTFTLPDTIIHEGEFVIIARDCSKGDFETFWNVVLGSNVLFINSANTLPMINGDESFAVYDSSGNLIDSTNTQMPPGENKCMERDSSNVNTWTALNSNLATPGYYGGGNHNAGLIISEFTDSTGTGNYVYEYIELYNDPNVTGLNSTGYGDILFYYDHLRQGIEIVTSKSGVLNVLDVSGRIMRAHEISGKRGFLPLVNLPAGVYFMQMSTEAGAFTGKFIIF